MEDQYFIASEEEILSKFKPIELSCWSPGTLLDKWVLWSKDEEEEATTSSVVSLAIKNQIKTFLCSFVSVLDDDVLIQFWAPTTTTTKMVPGSRPLLTTSRQPFAFSCMDEDEEEAIWYRKHCVGYPIGEGEGIIGRVFQNQLPEYCEYIHGNKHHPLQDIAESCGLTQVWALPVFRPSQQSHSSCVGVLEFLSSEYGFVYSTYFDGICSNLELAGLLTIDPQKIRKQIQEGINHVAEADEIKYALEQVCEAHDVSDACVWVRCKDSTSNCRYDDSKCKRQGDFVVFVPRSSAHVHMIVFRDILESVIMRVGQGLIGNAFLCHKPYVCTDLTQLSSSNYPIAHIVRYSEFTGCITICLQNITTGKRDYVLEFYLSQDMAHSKDLSNLLSSVLITLKCYLKSFVAVTGDPGNELFVEIDKFTIDSVFESDSSGKNPSSSEAPTDLAPKLAMNTMTVEATYWNGISEEEILSKFKPIELSCRSPATRYDLWVLWSKDEEEATSSSVVSLAIKNQIKTFLYSFGGVLNVDVLIQFWAPTTTTKMVPGGRPLLTTSRQPFAFSCLNDVEEDVIRYRKHCVGYPIGEGEGVVGRVFQNQLPEFCSDMEDYVIKDHPLQDIAESCGLTHVWALPVFPPSQQSHSSCVGVLEFLFPEYCLFYMVCFNGLCSNLEVSKEVDSHFGTEGELAGLLTIDPQKIRKQIQEGINHVAEADEIKYTQRQVCVAHGLSNACAWVRCKDSTSNCRYDDSKCKRLGDFVVFVPHSFVHVHYPTVLMRVGQGLIGNAFLSHKPYVCTDLTQLSISNYPMAPIVRYSEYTGCITICLQNITTGNRDYVLEFYLSQDTAHRDPGNELFVEIDKSTIDSVFESLKTCPTIMNETEPGAIHSEREVMLPASFPGHHLVMEELANCGGIGGDSVGLEQRGKAIAEVMQASFPGHHLVMEELTNCGGIGGDSVGLEQRGKAIAPKNNCLKKKSNIDLEDKRLQKKSNAHNQKESSCSYETLKQHFGRKLVDTAESLGVSRSTVKRWCRENNISRWPSPKRSKVTSMPPIPKQINELIQVCLAPISDSSGKHPSSSDTPTDLAPKRAMNTMTVMATYKNDIIKFQLPFSSRRIDLMEKVIVRLKLSEGTFTVKYLDEDGDYILICCDEDLQDCINNSRNLKQTAIKMLIEPLAISE